MVISRHVVQRGGQTLVSIPSEVRKRLRLHPRQMVYWHVTRGGEAFFSAAPARKGGRPPAIRLQEELTAAVAEIDRLRAKLQAQPEKLRAQVWRDRAMQQIHLELKGMPALAAINDRLRRIEDQLGTRRGPWSYRAKRGTPRTETVPGPDQLPPPDPSPSPVVVEQGADTSGRPAPGVPLET